MAVYTIKIDERNLVAKRLIKYIKELSCSNKSIEFAKQPNQTTVKAIMDTRQKGGNKITDVNDFFNSI